MDELFEHLKQEFTLPLSNPVLIFSLILMIILFSPILLRKLNIPGIIGLIIAGVIIGPHGFNIIAHTSAIELFSTIGLLYIMFNTGLELDMHDFKINRHRGILFGLLTFILPLGIGYPVCYYLLGYDFNASMLTASMFATHTLVTYPIISKFGVAKNQAVAVAVSGTILTDTAVLLILKIILDNNAGNLNHGFWIRMGISLLLFSAIIFVVIPRIAKWFFQKLESEKYLHYIFVLSVIFLAAFLAEIAGLEPIIGAFLAGLALNPLIPPSSALMNRIEFIGNSLFIPFFLISVGMLVDVGVIVKGPLTIIVAVTLISIALLSKWIAAYLSQLLFRYSNAQRQLIFGLSSARAAATLAVILVGYEAGILNDTILNSTIILILITCIVASFVTEKAVRKILVSDEDSEIKQEDSKYLYDEHILLPVANLDHLGKLMEFATLIKDKKSANPITMLTVVPNNEEAEINIRKSRKRLEEYVKQASATEIKVNTITAIDHNPASGIARTSKEMMADTVIIGWPEKTGLFDKIIGPKVESIIKKVEKNLFICRFNKHLIYRNRIVMITPPLVEKEQGFEIIIQKIAKIAQEFSIKIVCYAEPATLNAIQQVFANNKINTKPVYKEFNNWKDFLVLSGEIHPDDLIVFNNARKGSISYSPVLKRMTDKLDKYFSKNNLIVIYPQGFGELVQKDNYEDLTSAPLSRSIEAIEQIRKSLGNIFKKDKK